MKTIQLFAIKKFKSKFKICTKIIMNKTNGMKQYTWEDFNVFFDRTHHIKDNDVWKSIEEIKNDIINKSLIN